MAKPKRITILAGHYGSGKTHIAVNYALWLRAQGFPAVLADLDIVNPYFRTADAAALLREAGVELLSSDYALSNLDVPSVPGAVGTALSRTDTFCVLDVGGDDRGALALGRYAGILNSEPDRAIWLVINASRPLTAAPDDCAGILREIEAAARIRFTGLANNTHLAAETTPETVLASLPYAEAVSELTGLPIAMTAARQDLASMLEGKVPNLFALRILNKPEWDIL
jgi:hypothetical protein